MQNFGGQRGCIMGDVQMGCLNELNNPLPFFPFSFISSFFFTQNVLVEIGALLLPLLL